MCGGSSSGSTLLELEVELLPSLLPWLDALLSLVALLALELERGTLELELELLVLDTRLLELLITLEFTLLELALLT